MHLGVARKSIQPRSQFQRRLIRILFPRQTTRFHIVPRRRGHMARRGLRKLLRHPSDLEFGNPQHLGNVGESRAPLIRVEPADRCRMARSVAIENQIHHLVTTVVREIDVNIRQLLQLHPLRIEEAPEIQLEAHRTDRADPETVANQRICRASPRNPLDPALAATLQQFPNNEEVFLVPHLGDDAQFFLHLPPHAGRRHRTVTSPHPLSGQASEKLARR